MPQLDPSSFSSQLFWLVISFTLLFLFIWRYALPRIGGVVEARKEKISADLSTIEGLREKSQTLKGEYEKIILAARARGMEYINNAIRDAEKSSLDLHKQLATSTEKELSEAESRIQSVKKEALRNLNPVVEDVTSSIVKKLLGNNINQEDIKRFMTSFKNAA